MPFVFVCWSVKKSFLGLEFDWKEQQKLLSLWLPVWLQFSLSSYHLDNAVTTTIDALFSCKYLLLNIHIKTTNRMESSCKNYQNLAKDENYTVHKVICLFVCLENLTFSHDEMRRLFVVCCYCILLKDHRLGKSSIKHNFQLQKCCH